MTSDAKDQRDPSAISHITIDAKPSIASGIWTPPPKRSRLWRPS